jgi:hypothetical protein
LFDGNELDIDDNDEGDFEDQFLTDIKNVTDIEGQSQILDEPKSDMNNGGNGTPRGGKIDINKRKRSQNRMSEKVSTFKIIHSPPDKMQLQMHLGLRDKECQN